MLGEEITGLLAYPDCGNGGAFVCMALPALPSPAGLLLFELPGSGG